MQWPMLNHRFARDELERQGWAMCGQGDWAYGYRSPGGGLLARVSPFEPAYMYFVELCERCAGNRYVPRIGLATQLEGGGHLAVLEYLHPADGGVVENLLRHWEHPEDADLRALRHEVDMMDEWAVKMCGGGGHVSTSATVTSWSRSTARPSSSICSSWKVTTSSMS